MSYGNNRNSGIIYMRTYAQALNHFKRVLPIRGNGVNAGRKPLGHRDRPHFQILQGSHGEIICRCYNSDLVTYYADNTIKVVDGGYISQTTAAFIEDVLRLRVGVHDHDVVLHLGSDAYRVRKGLVLRANNDYYNNLEVIEYIPAVTHSINRKAMNVLRKEIAPFMRYLSGSIKARSGEFSNGEKEALREALGYRRLELSPAGMWNEEPSQSRQKLEKFLTMARGDDPENWYRASCWVAWGDRTWLSDVRLTLAEAQAFVTKILIAANPEVLFKHEVPKGKVQRDRYKDLISLMEMT